MLKMVAVGDVFLPSDHAPGAFSYTRELIGNSDVAFFNLECLASTAGEGIPGRSYGVLRIPPENLHSMVKAGFNITSLAHNHSLDFGVEALLDTRKQVSSVGLVHAGAGHDLAEASTPGVLNVKGQSVALLAYSSVYLPGYEAGEGKPGIAAMPAQTFYDPVPTMLQEFPGYPPNVRTVVNDPDLERLSVDIRTACSTADMVLVPFHFGIPGSAVICDYQKQLARHAIDSGAIAVLGTHPHVMQGIEIYRGRPIFYSLGNFVFELPPEYANESYASPYLPRETMLARWTIKGDGSVADIELVPLRIDDVGHPRPAEGQEFSAIETKLAELCKPFGTTLSAQGGVLKINSDH